THTFDVQPDSGQTSFDGDVERLPVSIAESQVRGPHTVILHRQNGPQNLALRGNDSNPVTGSCGAIDIPLLIEFHAVATHGVEVFAIRDCAVGANIVFPDLAAADIQGLFVRGE